MFGGSTTRGISDADSKTMPSYLAKVLNEADPKLTARVVNFGNDGYNGLLETKYLEKMLIESPTRPKLIVFYDGANDSAYFAQDPDPRMRTTVTARSGSGGKLSLQLLRPVQIFQCRLVHILCANS